MSLRVPTNPLDVLAQQIVAMVAMDEQKVDELYEKRQQLAAKGACQLRRHLLDLRRIPGLLRSV